MDATSAILVLAAGLTATLSGVLGMGGGMTLLGVMTLLLPPAVVVPLHGVVQLGSNASRTLVFWREVRWAVVGIYAGPLAVGVALSTLAWSGDKLDWFKPAIGAFLLFFLWWRTHRPTLRAAPMWTFAPLGLVVGLLTVFVGATGPFIAPFFLRDDFTKEEVIATKAVCQTWGHLLKIPAFLALGFDYTPHLGLLGALLAAVVLGTLAGKRVLGWISRERFEQAFVALLTLLALLLLLGPLVGAR